MTCNCSSRNLGSVIYSKYSFLEKIKESKIAYQLTYKYLVCNGIRMLLLDVGNAILRYGIRYVLINLEETQMYLVVYNIPYPRRRLKRYIF